MEMIRDYTTQLFRLATPLFLFLVSLRRKVTKGFPVSDTMVKSELEEIFARMEREARQDPRLDALYARAKYPLVVLADEVLLSCEWQHAETWQRQHLLEQAYFQSNIGGDKLFQIASELRYDDVEMASILYTAICLGARGTYHRKPEKLAEIKAKLYRQLSEYLAEVQKQITPEAYHVSARKAVKVSPAVTLARVAIVAVGIVVLYFLISRGLWAGLVSDLRGVVAGLG
ncbi:MAG TPA: DotU family type IV/VI secretion system protein [Thermoanaerobaculaceae bacterium]|nr:DotU family type IV/VI secretion system protein [Thermoanaerobaculaceae bacterium]HPS78962.1 DotU family type IV/VI secretion system protein [Thermoanaerobaculaceae bacterium]